MTTDKPYTAEIPIDAIVPNPEQPRQNFDPAALAELTASIKENGILQPILVEEAGPGAYILHAGERRLRACRSLGIATIPALVKPALNGTATQDRLLYALVENAQRQDMTPMEEARALGKLRDQGLTVMQVVDKTGMNWGTVDGRLLLLKLDPELQDLVEAQLLPADPRSTRAILSIADPAVRVKFGKRIARRGVKIKTVIDAANRLIDALKAQAQLTTHGAGPKPVQPLLANAGTLPTTGKPVNWNEARTAAQGMCNSCDIKASLPNVPEPAWAIVLSTAATVCDNCNLRPVASLDICRECPGVELLKRLASVAGKDAARG